ncbi:MAG: ketohydroxyglutarate aldolase [Acidimicrobiales bacterium]
MSGSVQVIVTVDDDHAQRLPEVADRLRAAGMEVAQTLDSIGTITGSVDESRLAGLMSVPGVEDVEQSRHYRIAPPDSPIQ